jgi:hypothetical protein
MTENYGPILHRLNELNTELETNYPQGRPLLVAVSKTVSADIIRAAYGAGQRVFGENKVPALVEKAENLKDLKDISWHFIGRLQRNKIRKIISIVSLIHSVDSLKLASAISRIALEENLPPVKILLEVNTSGEESKTGFTPKSLEESIDELKDLKGVIIEGFMTMAPFTGTEKIIRNTFATLAGISSTYSSRGITGKELSMGMTNDYHIAIDEGATIIRVGSKIFSEGQV